jgi:beta-glucosidase
MEGTLTNTNNMKNTIFIFAIAVLGFLTQCTARFSQPDIEAKKAPIITKGKFQFKDLNKNSQLDPYEDWRLPVDERIDNLVRLMTLEEKVGLMFHPNMSVPADGKIIYSLTDEERKALENANVVTFPGQVRQIATAKSFIEEKNFRILLNNGIADPKIFAQWSNGMQEIAEASRLGIPVIFSTDPRHGITAGQNPGAKQYFSQWPGYPGVAASRDMALIKQYGEIVAEEYRAVGLHMMLGPQIDVPTEPRWGRSNSSFSESAELTAEQLAAFMDGAQDSLVGPNKIILNIKHWPGGGSQDNGSAQFLVYPGNNFDYHLIPWKTGIAKGTLIITGFYVGTYFDTLGIGYSKYLNTEVLSGKLGFKGVISTDWGVINRGPLRPDLKDMSVKDRFEMVINAGVDQFGAETTPEPIIELVKEGKISEERINIAVKRILKCHFLLGLFEDPYVDPEAAAQILQSGKNQKAAYEAQLESVVLLTNEGILPSGKSDEKADIYVSGIDSAIAAEYGNVVKDPKKARLVIIKASTAHPGVNPFTSNASAEVNIDFPQGKWAEIKKLASTGVPVVAVFNLGGALTVLPKDLKEVCKASLMIFSVSDKALLDVIFGKFNPVGKLPFELPSSMDAVRKQLEDVPFDSENPMFEFGYGLSY